MTEGPLAGRTALVTGAGSPIGIGRAIAEALARAGARVAMMDIDAVTLERTAAEVGQAVGEDAVITIAGDVADAGDAERMVAETIQRLGSLNILVNNAGIALQAGPLCDVPQTTFWEIPVAAWDSVMAVNVRGPFLMARAAVIPMLRQGWGRIIGVTTSMDTMIRGRNLPYGASKSAHEAFMAAIAKELDGTGVTANVLVPGGATNTNLIPDYLPVDRAAMLQPEVMGPPAVWLASDEADQVAGRRIIASAWDSTKPGVEALVDAGAPAAWPQLAPVR